MQYNTIFYNWNDVVCSTGYNDIPYVPNIGDEFTIDHQSSIYKVIDVQHVVLFRKEDKRIEIKVSLK